MNLSSIFSNASKEKFARTYKPEEFEQPKLSTKLLQSETKKIKKPKKKKSIVDANNENIDISNNESGDGGKDKIINVQSTVSSNAELFQDPNDKDYRTIFIGNLPITETSKSITKLCKEFGEVESVRLRSVPVSGTKIDDAGNQSLVRKVCVNKEKFGEQKGSLNAYVVFKSNESVKCALTKGSHLIVGNRHVRVDTMKPTLFDPSRTVFLGALPHYADEEELREHFVKVLPNGQDDIDAVRLIRDPETLIGKGIGYLLLKDRDAVTKALTLHQVPYKKRWELRVSLCGKRTKRSVKLQNNLNQIDLEKKNDSNENNKRSLLMESVVVSDSKRPKIQNFGGKKYDYDKDDRSALNAMKRIKLKASKTRNQFLKENGQKKTKPGKKGKRLGGVVKRAMKLSKTAN
eukprot:gene8991-12126_t